MNERMRVVGKAIVLVVLVMILSSLAVGLWMDRPEEMTALPELNLQMSMTVGEFGEVNGYTKPALKEFFGLTSPTDLERTFEEMGLSAEDVRGIVARKSAIQAEYESKNWLKIPLKFGLWFLFLGYVFYLMRRGRVRPKNRKWLYMASLALFGVVLGSDPGPMGTVKDAIVLFGKTGAIFPPRLIAMSIFLALVVLANKFICSWGCQAGTLQDALFRINRDSDDRKGIFRQYKPAFALSNTVRILFFMLIVVGAILWGTDVVEPIDPFKIYKPAALGVAGLIFVLGLMVLSLFVYRPWCHFLCPFGLVGWILEKVSLYRIKVDYDRCIACGACERACPSTVMSAILRQDKRTIPDCFACATCINACPVDAISFERGSRRRPPEKKFETGRDSK